MTAPTTTTITGVSLLTTQGKRSSHSFDLALSSEGMEIRRAGRPRQFMSWDQVSRWDTEQRNGYVLLTLRGEGTATPLAVPAWTLEDLETVMRDMTADWPVLPAAAATDPAAPARLTRKEGEPRRSWRGRIPWKVVVTVVLLGLLATAVVLVLLQSAGIISWGFLGPTA